MKILTFLLAMFLFTPSLVCSDSTPMECGTLLHWKNVTIFVPNGFEYQMDERKMFFTKYLNNINNIIVISAMDTVDVDSFIEGLRTDGIKMVLLSVGEKHVGGQESRIVRYRIAEDDIKKITISYFIAGKNIRIVYYGLINEFDTFARIIDSLNFDE